jgi:hypothetical protein
MSSKDAEKNSDTRQEQKELLTRKDRQMFMELGMVASSNFLPWEAHAFFGQLLLADPLAAYPRLGLAHCKIMGGQFEEAHKLLKNEIVETSTLSAFGTVFRALAFHLAKQPKELHELFKTEQEALQKKPEALDFFNTLLTL